MGERQLQTSDLKTGLAIISKRIDTGSPWILTNNPKSKFWDDPEPEKSTVKIPYIGNKRYKSKDLLRASTAAPYFFRPHKMNIVEGEPPGLFVDGGVSPFNDPSLLLLMAAGIRGYGFNWPLGKHKILLVSIGAGGTQPRMLLEDYQRMFVIEFATSSLRGMIWDTHVLTRTLLQCLSRPTRSWPINSEIGDLHGAFIGGGDQMEEFLTYARYDIDLDQNWIETELGLKFVDRYLKNTKSNYGA